MVWINESFTQGESPSVENVPVSLISNHLLRLKLALLIMFSEKNNTFLVDVLFLLSLSKLGVYKSECTCQMTSLYKVVMGKALFVTA